MTSDHMHPDDWERLGELWEAASALPPDKRDEWFTSHDVHGALREELESLLAHADPAEGFFDRLQGAVAESAYVTSRSGRSAEVPPSIPATDHMIGTTAGRYTIESRLGQGGMGIVYRATDVALHRTVALKVLRAPDDPRAKDRLLGEARAAAALDNANICTIYEVGETAQQLPFIAMAFYQGETLEQLLRRGPLPVSIAIDYATQIARGLSAAHQRGIIHRDVKPANVIVTEDGVMKLVDFGIARHVDIAASHEGVTPGTIAYMSPEQVTSRAVDTRADLWSLGIVLYEMCTGVRPFAGEHAGAILYSIVHEAPTPPEVLRNDLPAHVGSIIERLLEKDPDSRYADADALIRDLTSDLPPAGFAGRAAPKDRTRWPRRAAMFSAALLAVVAFAVSWRGRSAPAPPQARLAAQDLYDQGHRDILFRTENGRQEALGFIRQSIATDSTFATAHAGLAHLLVMISDNTGGSRKSQLAEAEVSARTAIRLDSLHANAHASLGHVLLFDYRFADAELEFKRALALDPTTQYLQEFFVWLYIFMDKPREALAAAERGVADNPMSPTAIAEQARALLVDGRCDVALPLLKRLMLLQPPPARVGAIAAQCYAQQGMWKEAIDAVRGVAERTPLQGTPWLAYMLARSGDTVRARALRDTLQDHWRRGKGGAYGVVVANTGLRDFDAAFEWLDKSIDERSLHYSIMEPAFDDLRRDPRFENVRKKLGIN